MLQGHAPLCEPTAVIARATVSLECIGSLMHVPCFFVNGATASTNATNLACGILMYLAKSEVSSTTNSLKSYYKLPVRYVAIAPDLSFQHQRSFIIEHHHQNNNQFSASVPVIPITSVTADSSVNGRHLFS